MTRTAANKTLLKSKNENYSVGFNRYLVLPIQMKKNLGIAHFLKTKSTDCHNTIVNFFSTMTEREYVEYLVTHN